MVRARRVHELEAVPQGHAKRVVDLLENDMTPTQLAHVLGFDFQNHGKQITVRHQHLPDFPSATFDDQDRAAKYATTWLSHKILNGNSPQYATTWLSNKVPNRSTPQGEQS